MSSESPAKEYPPIVKGGSLLLAYQLKDRPVLLIGGGVVASGRLFFLLEAGAHVTLVAPSPLHPEITHRLQTNPSDITWHDRSYSFPPADPLRPEDYAMVLTAIDDNALSRAVCDATRAVHVPVNVADVPPECDFYFGAQFRRGPLQVMVSTQGQGPKIGAIIRDRLLEALPDDVEGAIAGVGALRADLRRRAPGVGGQLGQERMRWMIGMCNRWTLDEMVGLKVDRVRNEVLDKGWSVEEGKGKKVVGPEEVGVGSKRKWWEGVRGLVGALQDKVGTGPTGFALGLGTGAVLMMAWTRR